MDDAGKDPIGGVVVELDVRHLTPHIAQLALGVTGRFPNGQEPAAADLPLPLPWPLLLPVAAP
jgi:hypothetical protein